MGWFSSAKNWVEYEASSVEGSTKHLAHEAYKDIRHTTHSATRDFSSLEHGIQKTGGTVYRDLYKTAGGAEHEIRNAGATAFRDITHAGTSVEHEIASVGSTITQGIDKEGTNVYHEIAKAGNTVEHGLISATNSLQKTAGLVEQSVVRDIDKLSHAGLKAGRQIASAVEDAGKTSLSYIKKESEAAWDFGKKISKETENFAIKEGKVIAGVSKDLFKSVKDAFEDTFDFFNPFDWSWSTWFLIIGGAVLTMYVLYETFTGAIGLVEDIGPTAAGGAAMIAAPEIAVPAFALEAAMS